MPADAAPPAAAGATRRQRLAQLYRVHAERLKPKQFRAPSLDALNFLVADVRGALGPYVTVYLAAYQHWALADIGLVTTLGGYLGLLAQTPLGWLIDSVGRKRVLLMFALAVLGAGAAIIAFFPTFWPVLVANAAMQIVSGVFQPAISALTVGLFAREALLTRRMGRNAAFARAGNLSIAAAAAGLAWAFTPIQAVLTWLFSQAAWLIGVQVLGGFGTGLFAALTPLLLADVTRGTGRYNLSQGAVATLRSIGVTSSGLATEFAIAGFGYGAVFLGCGVVGLAALGLLWWAMPQTSPMSRPDRPGAGGKPGRQGPEPSSNPPPNGPESAGGAEPEAAPAAAG